MDSNFKIVFENNYESLCNYAKVIVKDEHIAEDLVQTVFIQIWESNKWNQLENLTPYLLKCTRYKCLDYNKSNYKKLETPSNVLPEITIEDQQTLKDEDVLPLLHFYASQLPTKMQEVFLLSRKDGLTYNEIASKLNISYKTVENQMGAALKKLRLLFQKHHYLPLLVLFI